MPAGKKKSKARPAPRRLSKTKALLVALKLQRELKGSERAAKTITRKATATGSGAVVFRASRVLDRYLRSPSAAGAR